MARLKKQLILVIFCITLSLPTYAEKNVVLDVQGIEDKNLITNVNNHLSLIDADEFDGSIRNMLLIQEYIANALKAYGYYDSRVKFNLIPLKKAKSDLLIADVELGEPVVLTNVDVIIQGFATSDENFIQLNQELPKRGDNLNHGLYDKYKDDLDDLAILYGYFDANFERQAIEVDPINHQGAWRLTFNSGKRYRYGDIKFHGSQIKEEMLVNIPRIKTNDYYVMDDLAQVTNDFSYSGWFSSVLIEPVIHKEANLVDLNVRLLPNKRNQVDLGIGYETNYGARLQVGWTKPWLNSRGDSLVTKTFISKPKNSLDLTYKQPLARNPLNYYYEYNLGFENEDKNDTKSNAITASGLRYWNHAQGWQYGIGIGARYDSFTQAEIKHKTLLVYPILSLSRTRVQGGVFPTSGDVIRITINVGRKNMLSDVDFYSIKGVMGMVRSYKNNHRAIGRVSFGYIHTNNFERLPPSFRFFAGGDRSIRGYPYQSISPKDQNGELTGASRYLSGSIEYQYQVQPNWWGAIFYDTGFADHKLSKNAVHSGAGVGIRWVSPVGAIKFDLAKPVMQRGDNKRKKFQYYIGFGMDL